MLAAGTPGKYVTQGVYTVSFPSHPFGGAVDIVVVQQKDGTFKSSPWYVKFGKIQGVLTRKEKVVDVTVNDVPTDFHMCLDHKGGAFFEKEVQYDEETLPLLPGASSVGDEMAELGREKRLTYSNDSTAEGLEMQEGPNWDSGTTPVGIMNECNNPNSVMSDDSISAPVDTASTVWVPHTSLNQTDSEVAIALPETNCSLVEEQNETSNSNEKEESKPASGQLEFGQCPRPDKIAEGSKQTISEYSNFVETGSLTHSPEGSADVMNEAPSRHSECKEFSRPKIHTEAFEQSIMENTATDDLQADMMRLETSANREFAGEEGSFLHSAPEDQRLIPVSNENSGDVSSSSDSLCKPIYERDQNGRCHEAHTGNEEVTLVGTTDKDVDRSTEALPSPGVVLMSGDGHGIIAPVDVESNQVHNIECGWQVDSSKEFPSGSSCSHNVQVVASSSGDSESLESDRSKQPAVVSVSSTVGALGVAIASELNRDTGNSGEPVRIEEVPADPLDGEVDAGKASEFSSRDTNITSTEMAPEFVSEIKFKNSEDSTGSSSQNPKVRSEHMVMTFLTAVDMSGEEGNDCVPEYPVVRKLTAGQNDVDVQRDTGINTDQSGNAAGCLPGDVVRDTSKIATPSDNRLADSSILTDVDLARPNIELDSGMLESPGQQVLKQFYSCKEGQTVDFKNEDTEEDVLKNCLHLDKLPNCSGDEAVVAFLEVDDTPFELGHNGYAGDDIPKAVSEIHDPVFDERHSEQNLSSCKAMDSDLSEQPMEARPGTFTWVRSKPVPVRQGFIKKKAQLTSSASLPCRLHEAEREVHAYSRSVGSSPMCNVNPLHVKADATNSFNKGVDESVSIVDLVDMQVIKDIIYGSGKDSEIIVNAADDCKSPFIGIDLSLCRHLLSNGMGADAAAKVFASHKVTFKKFQHSGSAMFGDDKLVVKIGERYFSWGEAAPYILDMRAAGSESVHKIRGGIAVETNGLTKDGESQAGATVPSGWKIWPFSVRRSGRERGPLSASTVPQQALLTATNIAIASPFAGEILRKHGYHKGTTKFKVRTYIPTSQQLASLGLKEGSNKVTFGFALPILGKAQVDARIYLWKWNTRIVVSDVDGTITWSDLLGQLMPLVGRDWTQSGVTRLFSAIKDNGYELLFLSARALSQACSTRQFLLNLKQDGEGLPDGPVFLSPDGLIPSFYREVVRRAPHEFKISCLEEIRELFPSDVNPFYAGFGNRDTDEICYLKVGIPKGKIFIINPKGEVVVNHHVDSKSYSSLHTLVDNMFPPMSSGGQEAFNSWNFWKLPLPDIDDELNLNRAKSSKRVAGSKRAWLYQLAYPKG